MKRPRNASQKGLVVSANRASPRLDEMQAVHPGKPNQPTLRLSSPRKNSRRREAGDSPPRIQPTEEKLEPEGGRGFTPRIQPTEEKLATEGGGGFNPRIEPTN